MENYLREITQDNLSKAIKKARRVKPLVRRTDGASIFKVRSSDGETFYRVRIGKSGNKFIADCQCKGFVSGENCYHVAAVTGVAEIFHQSNVRYMANHLAEINQRKQAA